MANLSELFYASLQDIEREKEKGVSFQWKDLDLSDLLLAEWIAYQIKPTQSKRLFGIHLIKHQFHAWRQRRKFKTKHETHATQVLVFFNSQNQWSNLQAIVMALVEQGIKVHVMSTKPNLLVQVKSLHIPYTLCLGYKSSSFHQRSKIELQHIINTFLPKLNYLYHQILPYLNSQSLDYVLIGNDNTAEGRLVARLAKQKNKLTGSIQHGSMNRINPIHGRSVVDQFFVYGDKPKQELIYLGKSANQIFIKGWPLQEQFKHRQQNAPAWKGFDKPTVLITFSGPGHGTSEAHHVNCIQMIRQVQKELNLNICIKLHPKDQITYYNGFIDELTTIWTNKDLEQLGISFHQVLEKSQIVITGASNSALDALLMQTEALTLDLIKAYKEVDFVKDGLVIYCNNIDSLKETLSAHIQSQKIPFSTEKKRLIETYYYRFFDDNYSPIQEMAHTIQEAITTQN